MAPRTKKQKVTVNLEFASREEAAAYLMGGAPAATVAVKEELAPAPGGVLSEAPTVAPAPVQPALDTKAVIDDVQKIYAAAAKAGVQQELLNKTISAQLAKIGHPEEKLSALPDAKLLEFHQGFSQHVQETLIPAVNQAAAGPASFV